MSARKTAHGNGQIGCAVAGCGRKLEKGASGRGLCHAHFVRQSLGLPLAGAIRSLKRLGEEDKKTILALHAKGKGPTEIGAKIDRTKSTVQNFLRRQK